MLILSRKVLPAGQDFTFSKLSELTKPLGYKLSFTEAIQNVLSIAQFEFPLLNGEIITHPSFKDSAVILERRPQHFRLTVLSVSTDQGIKLMDSFLRDCASILKDEGELQETYKINTFGEKINLLFGIQSLSQADTELRYMVSPDTPFSNETAFMRIFKACKDFIQWEDKYFTRKGLEILANSIRDTNVSSIKILTSLEKADKNLKESFKSFQEEMKKYGIESEMRVIIDHKLTSDIHDRYVITVDGCFNLPSPDVVARGQYSDINESNSRPPFDSWWGNSLDLLTQWQIIEEARKGIGSARPTSSL